MVSGAAVRRNFPGMNRKCPGCKKDIVVTEQMCKRGKYRCMACESAAASAWAKRNMARKIAGNKRYLATPKGKVANLKRTRKFRERYPERKAAHQVVQTAKRNGTLKVGPCEMCGNPKAEAHHDDYSKPLEVRWLCDKCHVLHHRVIAERQKARPE